MEIIAHRGNKIKNYLLPGNNALNIVIPMAGAGSRFKVAGYEVPKPFIKFNDKMMIEHVLQSFKAFNAKFTIVIQESLEKDYSEKISELKNQFNISPVSVPRLTMGAAITALASHKNLDKNLPVLFVDSDNIFFPEDIINFLDDADKRNLDASLLVFDSSDSFYSYALTNKNGYLVETKEKKVISNNAICGVYYFKKVDDFIMSTIDLIVASDLQNGEFYMSNVYNYLLKYKKNVGIFSIKKNNFKCVGTPEQLNKYIEENNFEKIQ